MTPSATQIYAQAPASSTSLNESLSQSISKQNSSTKSRPETADEKSALGRRTPSRLNPFATPYSSNTTRPTSPALRPPPSKSYFRSRRVEKGAVEKPWIKNRDPHEKWVTVIALFGILVGLGVAGLLVWDGMRGVVNNRYCSVYESDFTSDLDPQVWTREAEVGGFGNGQFEQTTNTDENVFVSDGLLHIKPTLQDPNLIYRDSVIDLRKDGICSSNIWSNCITSTNTTNGTIVNPVKSGRISTKKGARIKYGRIEVTAKLPAGDWLWPAIWLLPADAVYGSWPQSGEIDIVEGRGNSHSYAQGGNNVVSSTLHFGPNAANDGWYMFNNKRTALHTTYSDKYHTFGLEWSENFMFTFIDNRLLQVLYTGFDQPFWDRGNFPLTDSNGTRLIDPWSQTGRPSTPFDQDFYLILNVAVGGTNGWFEDGKSGKPWVDASDTARRDFWNAQGQWFPTWEEKGEMLVKSVKIYQQEGYGSCPMGSGKSIR